ncbi:beta strand repeat-containing protein [Ideonella sp. YS5]|uniref:beta strand repeat-containing protein n=1 Tax=Ideonella sp. YS5 TaxID=3453714 RepID=UPI003EE8A368
MRVISEDILSSLFADIPRDDPFQAPGWHSQNPFGPALPFGGRWGHVPSARAEVDDAAALLAVPLITVSDAIAGESDGNLAFVVTLSASSAQTVSVDFNNSNATALNGSDYVAQTGTVTFTPGQTTQTILIPLVDNATPESTEYLKLNLFNAVNGTVVRTPAWGTIVDNDAATGTPLVSVSDRVVDESAGTVTFYLTLDRPAAGNVKVDVATADGTAIAGADYVAKSLQTLTFAPGQVTKTVTVNLIDDGSAEGAQYFDLLLSNPVGVTLRAEPHGRATIGANDAPAVAAPLITVSDAVVGESDGTLLFVVSLSAPSTQTVTVNYNNSNLTAANGSDYQAQTGTLTFAPGQTTQTVLIPVLDNATLESTEFLTLNLFGAVNGTVAREFGYGTIVDNDATSGTPVARVGDVVVDESAGTVTFNVTLDRPSAGTVKVDYASADGTAAAGADYVATGNHTLTFATGEVSKTVTVDLIDDASAEGRQYFDLLLSNAVGATLLPEAHGRASIGANDGAPVAAPLITVSDASASETDGTLEFIVTLSAPSTQVVTVGYNNSNMTAANGSDYLALTGTLTFAPGQTTQVVRIPVLDNVVDEANEYLTLNLFGAVNGTVARQSGWGTIVDNDSTSGTPVLRVGDQVVDETAGTVTFTVTLDRPSTGTVNVDYATANGTAKSGSDYVATGTHTLSFLAGEVSKTVTVDLINDGGAEVDQYFDLVLSNAVNGSLLPETHGRATIGANDAPAVAAPLITVSDAVAGESDGTITFTVSLNAPSTQTVSVNYNDSNLTAANGSDYLARTGTLVFAPGQTTQTVTISVLDNSTQEATEFMTLNLFGAVNGTVVREFGIGTLVDNDSTSGTPALRVGDQVVDEAAGTVTVTLTLDKPSVGNVSVDYATANGTALAGSDYTAVPTHSLSFLPGEVAKTIVIDLTNDGSPEPGEFFDLLLSSPVGATVPDTNARIFISPSDAAAVAAPLITVSDATAGEADGYLEFVVSLSAPSNNMVTVNYNNSNLTAANGSDYLALTGTLSFAPGQTTQVVRIPVLDNTTQENAEFMTLNLFGATNGTIVRQSGWGSITDNDATTGTPVVSVSDAIVDESGARMTFTVTLDKPSTSQVSVKYATADGTASSGSDYEAQASQKLVFGPGEVSKTLTIDLRGDTKAEEAEYFDLVLSGAVNATIGDARGHAFIPKSDATAINLPTIAGAAISASEGGGYIDFVVTLDGPSTQTVSVNYNNSNGTAANGSDYVARTGTLYFAPGETIQVIRMPVLDDVNAESTETFNLNLFGAVNAQVGTSQVVASIADNDGGPPSQIIDLGTGNPDILVGRPGANEVEGGQGNDVLDGANGVVMRGNAGNDLYIVEAASDKVSELSGEGTDRVASYVNYTLTGNVENLLLRGGALNGTGNSKANSIVGNDNANTLSGLGGNDSLDGATGADTMIGGLGNDTSVVDNAGDVVTEAAGEGTDVIQSSVTRVLDANVENLTLTGSAAIDGTGNSLNNILLGNAGNNILDGDLGSDQLTGGAGGDTFGFGSLVGLDSVADFDAAADTVRISMAGIPIGDGDTVVENGTTRGAPGGFTTSAELVIFTAAINGAITTASAAAAIGSATSAYATGATVLFVVNNGTQSGIFQFESAGTDALVSAAELTEIATLSGDLTTLNDYIFGP